jgi:cytochrome oxidase Cu insertion factor (SCO1/SenC/PrrC family)
MIRSVFLAVVICVVPMSMLPQAKPYPKPQVESPAGKPTPDFTLNDENGKQFRLSDQHGKWVLLYFYRGYW